MESGSNKIERVREKADARALRIIKRWRAGESYRTLAKKLNISIGRVREIVRRGKNLEVKS